MTSSELALSMRCLVHFTACTECGCIRCRVLRTHVSRSTLYAAHVSFILRQRALSSLRALSFYNRDVPVVVS